MNRDEKHEEYLLQESTKTFYFTAEDTETVENFRQNNKIGRIKESEILFGLRFNDGDFVGRQAVKCVNHLVNLITNYPVQALS